ncbi:BatA and WFA domain-containing protein [bacterium SCSIO 12741]|nr:BatA and WFA domain-containing protein [bacterium SCSIO 12741]
MNFVYPGFLFALLAIAIPILIHLFNFRKFKRVYFSHIRFLREVQEETKSRSRLKHLLILASRILAVAFLVLAFAQPYVPLSDQEDSGGKRAISIYVDNSFSMNNQGEQGDLLETARQYAYEVLKSYSASDRFQIITNDYAPGSGRLLNRESAEAMIAEITPSGASRPIGEIIGRQINALEESNADNKEVFLITDFQKSQMGDSWNLPDSSYPVHLIPLAAQEQSNISLDTCWFESPVRQAGVTEKLFFTLTNYSDQELNDYTVRLSLNGQPKGVVKVSVSGGATVNGEFNFTVNQSGLFKGLIEVDDYPVAFDNRLYFSYEVEANNQVLVINEQDSSPAFHSLFGRDSNFILSQTSVKSLNTARFASSDLIVLNGVREVSSGLRSDLRNYVDQGGHLVLFPGKEINRNSYQQLLQELNAGSLGELDTHTVRVNSVAMDDPLFADVFLDQAGRPDLPVVLQHYPLLSSGDASRTRLMGLANGQDFLVRTNLGSGQVYLWAAAPDESFGNLGRHAMFVLSLYRFAIYTPQVGQLFFTLGNQPFYLTEKTFQNDAPPVIRSEDSEFIPEIRSHGNETEVWFYDQIKTDGHFELINNGKTEAVLSANYPRTESDPRQESKDELEARFTDLPSNQVFIHDSSFDKLGVALQEIRFGKKYWKTMLLLALAMILFEVFLIKFWKE